MVDFPQRHSADPRGLGGVPARRAIGVWLLACCALVFTLVLIGGVTRLTHSGLSIVEWQPIVGTLPPLNQTQWQEAFANYRETPQFRLRNHSMTLAGFKEIFWWEYIHRLLGRLVGVAFLVPFVYFLMRRAIRGALAWKLGAIFILGAVQGAVGWFMVQSGLIDDPRVSPVRLGAHLGIAFVIYGAMLWIALEQLLPAPRTTAALLRGLTSTLVALVFVTAISGALVAGIRAGSAYNTFPLMDGHWVPPEILMIEPWWNNFFFNMATVQFDHRLFALAIALGVAVLWVLVRRQTDSDRRTRLWANVLATAVLFQIAAGIATLLLRVPLPLATLHQAGALAVFTCALGLRHALR
ncbi:MAG TPA: COX15/CtaA family protein [Usitatibacter sp.]|nr:COX15/CtaA family protein [Usitatibacter sp.]